MKIVFTGGGSGGHVTPNIAIIEEMKKDHEIIYIGSINGIEKKLIEDINIPYKSIETGKLRRYLSKENLKDFFKVFKGISEAKKLLKEINPDIVFSKGGFVSVPVVIGASLNKIPIVIHESDMTSGLANKIAMPFAKKICVSFEETMKNEKRKNMILTGTPVRREIFEGSKEKGYKFTGLTKDKPIIIVMGGSLGAESVNKSVRENLDELTKEYQIIHLCGKGKVSKEHENIKGYIQYEYVSSELKDMFAVSDLIITRAGANSIFEILLLTKPNILIPLSKKASRGDQILNAESFRKQGFSYVIEEEELTSRKLSDSIKEVLNNKDTYIEAMKKTTLKNGTETIINILEETKR